MLIFGDVIGEEMSRACSQLYDNADCYICMEGCGYFLHESCGQLPMEVRSPFHTPHPLTRQLCTKEPKRSISRKCSACGEHYICTHLENSWFFFSCESCDFQLDQECALLRPEEEVPEKKVYGEYDVLVSFTLDLCKRNKLHTHPNHQHPLLLFHKMPEGEIFNCSRCGKNCSMCGKNCSNLPTYCCCECQLYLHISCFERKLPQNIQHFYHPHPLTLSPTQLDQNIHHLSLSASMLTVKIQCQACYRESSRLWYYSCKQCNFDMDIDCSTLLRDIKSESEEQIQHFLHGHPLSLSPHNDKYPNKCCFLCGKGCAGHTTYVCRVSSSYCNNIYFHKSCLVFPQHIFHPLHPYHRLTLANLKFKFESLGKCKACQEWPYEFSFTPSTYNTIIYSCEANCKFFLHAECGVMIPVVTYEGHGHLLQFRDIENNKLHCCACNSQICELYAFTCLYCDLSLHLLCGPLPYTIQHNDHNTHSLFLTNSPVQEELEDETDEFYCHVCEEERDPRLPVYYCAECYFVAEFKCVLTQIILSLKGECGDIELRNTLGQPGQLISANSAREMWQNKFKQVKQTSTLSDILGSSRKDVIEELSNVSMAMKAFTIEEDGHYKDSEYSEDFLFSDEAYTQFMKFLDSGKGNPDPWKDPEEYVNIGDYMVPLRLANILRQLLSRYGDIISAKSMLSPMAKLYLFIALCECIYSMTNTRVVDISKDLLLKWWTGLKMLKTAGFEIQFAINHLKRVADAYFGLCVEKRVDKIDNDIFELHKEVQNLQNKIEALEKERECIRSAESAKSNLIEKCLREASIFKHGKASAGLVRIL